MKQDMIAISNQPAIISANFEELQAALAKDLEKYDVLVTADTVADAKKLATELNATKKFIGQRRKEEADKASAPVKAFIEQMKGLEQQCEDGRQKLLVQVEKFEDEQKQIAREKLADLLANLFLASGVEDEFKTASYDDLIKLTALTKTGNLTAAVTKELESRVAKDKAIQDRTKMRLLELENKSYSAGLSAPLTRDHVQHFLFDDDEQYASQLQRIMDAEISRQEVAEQRERERIEREQRQTEKAEREHQERLARMEPASIPPEDKQEPAKFDPPESRRPADTQPQGQDDGRVECTVTCTFSTRVAPGVKAEAVEAELRKVMQKAGISTLQSVKVELGNE